MSVLTENDLKKNGFVEQDGVFCKQVGDFCVKLVKNVGMYIPYIVLKDDKEIPCLKISKIEDLKDFLDFVKYFSRFMLF